MDDDDEGRIPFVECLNEASNVTDSKQEIVFSFRKTESITISAGIYLRAFFDYLKKLQNPFRIICPDSNSKIREVLQHLGIKSYGMNIKHEDIKCWKVLDWDLNKEPPNFSKILMEEILPDVLENGKIRPSKEFGEIATALQEVLANCTEHAYNKDEQYSQYYMIAGKHPAPGNNGFAFSVVDRGQGFRESMQKQKKWFNRLLPSQNDTEVIKKATQGASASGEKNTGRGTGLQTVIEKISLIKGEVMIISRCGRYTSPAQNKSKEPLNTDTKGTIITMMLPINKEDGD